MNNKGRLIHNLTIVLATAMLLVAVTIAWFVNWTSPAVDSLNFSPLALSVDVKITSEDAQEITDKDNNILLVAENMKPGDVLVYDVALKNRGSDSKVYFGISDIKNFKKGGAGEELWVPVAGDVGRLSDVIRISIWGKNPEGVYVEMADKAQIIGTQTKFFFPNPVMLGEGEEANFQYRVAFVANLGEGETKQLTGNQYTEKQMTAKFAITSTLAK